MISKARQKSGSSGQSIGYMLGDMLEKDQRVRIINYNGFLLSRRQTAEIEAIPSSKADRKAHKKEVWKIANSLSKVFDARASLADYRVKRPLEDYIVSCVHDERERLRRVPTLEEKEKYGLDKNEERPLEQIIVGEFLEGIGVHGNIEKRYRRKAKGSGKMHIVKQREYREALYLAVAHDGAAHPHIHILTARPDASGKVNDTRDERYRMLAVVRRLSKRFDLALKLENYEVDLEKTNEGYATKIQMRYAVEEALKSATSHDELLALLAKKGVVPSWRAHSDTGEWYGILFEKLDKKGKRHKYSGSQLSQSLSFRKIEEALAANLVARQAQEKANRVAVQRELARRVQEQAIRSLVDAPNTFVIHNGMAATLYVQKNDKPIYEAARAILKYYTWGADLRTGDRTGFVESARKGQFFGKVLFNEEKAHIIGNKILENPEEVITFIDSSGKELNLITQTFQEVWNQEVSYIREWDRRSKTQFESTPHSETLHMPPKELKKIDKIKIKGPSL